MLGRSPRDSNVDEGNRPRDRAQTDAERRLAAWIGSSVVIQGQLTSSEDMTIAGRVKGDVEVRDNVVVIAAEAHIEGNVTALGVVVNGRVTGDIEAKRNIEIGATGSVTGDIMTPRMTVAEGGTLNGRLTIAGQAAPSAKSDPARRSPT